jgi:hypothetical protein
MDEDTILEHFGRHGALPQAHYRRALPRPRRREPSTTTPTDTGRPRDSARPQGSAWLSGGIRSFERNADDVGAGWGVKDV